MKKIIISGFFVAAFAFVATIFYNNSSKPALSDLAKANIKALAANEENTGDLPCEGCGGNGQVWVSARKGTVNSNGKWKYTKGTNGKCSGNTLINDSDDGNCWM